MAAIETVLGSSQELDGSSIVYLLVECAAAKFPVITANFAGSVKGGYVVSEIPENLAEAAIHTIAKEEYEMAWFYVEGLREHNAGEREKLESYELRRLQQEEDAKKSPLERILEGFVSSGILARPMLSTYRKEGLLYQNQVTNLLKLLKMKGADADFLTEVEEILSGREFIEPGRMWRVLTRDYSVRLLAEEPRPVIDELPVPPLTKELEAIVAAALKRASLDEEGITGNAWEEAGISWQGVYDKVADGVRPLNSTYILVKVGNERVAGNVRLLEADKSRGSMRQGTPKILRSGLKLPSELLEDFYRLAIAMAYTYVEEVEDKLPENLERPEWLGAAAVIFERILNGNTEIAASLYTDVNRSRLDEYRLRYGNTADWVVSGIESGSHCTSYDVGNGRSVYSAELRDALNYLAGIIPKELFLLRTARTVAKQSRKDVSGTEKAKTRGMQLTQGQEAVLEQVRERYRMSSGMDQKLSGILSLLAEGANKWPDKTGTTPDVKTLELYGLLKSA